MDVWVIALPVALALLGLALLAWAMVRGRGPQLPAVDEAEPQDAQPTQSAPARRAGETAAHSAEVTAYQAACADMLQRLHPIAFDPELADGRAPPPGRDTVEKSVHTRLVQIAEQPNYAPRRPMLLPRLIQAMRDDDVSRRELAQIISTDPVLTGNLVRLANSPVYRHSDAAIESIDRAVAVLGTEGMRSLATAALLQPVFRISGRHFAHFGEVIWQHTFLSASAAEAHAAVIENSDPFAAQLLGLIMGLATIVVFRVASDAYLESRKVPVAATIAGLIDSKVVPVGRQIAASWELSERMDVALADQAAAPSAELSSLGRSLQFGRFAGALAMLRARALIDDEAVLAALGTGGQQAEAYTRIWSRLAATHA
jgi:HD-like signal output (HDOD) protein